MALIIKYRFSVVINSELDGKPPRQPRNAAMPKHFRTTDAARKNLSAIENSAIDELLAGRIGRREFLRHGSDRPSTLPWRR
ncbi:MAG: hypothetical protein EOS61_31020, partial [Mesorhizobium sp.]